MLAADQFIIAPFSRIKDVAHAHATEDEIRTIIAGYHWFTDWSRDTMIALEGLTLTMGRYQEAKWILHTFNLSFEFIWLIITEDFTLDFVICLAENDQLTIFKKKSTKDKVKNP